jgi:asparagine synthetase B (glutamine-hydrolysing)
MCNENADVWITYNGEIYNHRQLRAELQALGHCFGPPAIPKPLSTLMRSTEKRVLTSFGDVCLCYLGQPM